MNQQPLPITISIVTYQSSAVIPFCLESLPQNAPVIVVDNASTDGTQQLIKAACPRATLIANSRNLGFGAAHNLAVAQAETPFVFLLNPDAVIVDDCLERLLTAAEIYPEAAILAPALLDSASCPQKNSFNSAFFRRKRGGDGAVMAEGEVCAEFLSGAALLVRTAIFRSIGGFDENLFLFYEDDDLCLRSRAAGHSCILVPQASVRHVAGQSTPTRHWAAVRLKYAHMAYSELYTYAKYCGRMASLRQAALGLLNSAAKCLAYAMALRSFKAQKYAARLLGALCFLAGKRPGH